MPWGITFDSQKQLQLWNDFLMQWPAESVAQLTLDQYVLDGEKKSFCYTLEYATQELGTIWGAIAYKYGIYKFKNTKIDAKGVASDGTYVWRRKFGESADEVFTTVKESIVNIIDAARNSRFDQIENIATPLFPLVKWKIAFLYQPIDAPALLPIYTAEKLGKLADMPANTPVYELQRALMRQKPTGMTLLDYYDNLLQTRTDVFGGNKENKQSSPSGESSGNKKTEDIDIAGSGDEKSEKGLSHEPIDENGDSLSRNLIYFGAPGTGKSYKLKVAVEGEKDKDGNIVKDKDKGIFIEAKGKEILKRLYERVTFYPTYSYAQFVGCYKPVMHGNEIAYEFVPGPFLRVLVNALNEKPGAGGKKKNWCLVIEEINRANAAAVFGDVFQLLDRPDGISEYDVAASEDVKKYLKEVVKSEWGRKFLGMIDNEGKEVFCEDGTMACRLRIPSNMYIWATMNSADQGVFPLDTAFKRRWEFEYIDIDNGEDKSGDGKPKPEEWTIEGKEYEWNMVRKFINGLLSLHGVNEDKLMGARFVTASGKIVAAKSFESKVLMYLWEDAGRMCRKEMFGNNILTYSGLVDEWNKSGIVVFQNDTKMGNLGEDLKKWYGNRVNKEEK